ncbi:hypothetical protein V5F34_25550, partial [Xanthobacter autotrophicus]
MTQILNSYALDRWFVPQEGLIDIPSAIDGRVVARTSTKGLDLAAMVRHAREVGGPALRGL